MQVYRSEQFMTNLELSPIYQLVIRILSGGRVNVKLTTDESFMRPMRPELRDLNPEQRTHMYFGIGGTSACTIETVFDNRDTFLRIINNLEGSSLIGTQFATQIRQQLPFLVQEAAISEAQGVAERSAENAAPRRAQPPVPQGIAQQLGRDIYPQAPVPQADAPQYGYDPDAPFCGIPPGGLGI